MSKTNEFAQEPSPAAVRAPNDSNESSEREELSRRADEVRSQLLRTLDEANEAGREVVDPGVQLRKHRGIVVAGTTAAAVAIGLGAGWAAYRHATRENRLRRNRWRLLGDAWRHPDRARRSQRGSFAAEAGRSIVLSLLTAAVTLPLKHLLSELVERDRHATGATAGGSATP